MNKMCSFFYECVFMKTSSELNHKLYIFLGERMIEFEEKLCTLLEERHRHCDLTGGVIQAMAKSSVRLRTCLCALDLL